ncbi:MAG: glycosyl hydrolase [Dysgonamonadaceae bacterium]|nr:glycosyl hydrolase [Dysgonamonadaceae bacterium]
MSKIESGFVNPPDSARPGVYWYFMDGNISKSGITKDLESMKKAGIGYVLFLEVGIGIPRGTVDYMSEEWQDCFVHAVRECERLGIVMAVGIGPGWNGSGGPWVEGNKSMQHLVYTMTDIKGGKGVQTVVLPRPAPRKPFFGEGSFGTEKERDKWKNYYEDVTVLAVPAGATRIDTASVSGREYLTIPEIDERALYYRKPYSSVYGVPQYITLSGYLDTKEGDVAIDTTQITDLSHILQPDGTINWNAPEGNWTIMRFGAANNGSATRPAPLPGIGFESDKLDSTAIRDHLNNFTEKLFKRASFKHASENKGGIKLLHFDSWEMGAQNWTPNLREHFIRKRGYDPKPYYPVYAGLIVESREISERFLWDLRTTCQELVIEQHIGYIKKYASNYGLKLSIEPYDLNPTSDVELGAAGDIPMCEFWSTQENEISFNSAFSIFEGTSAAHIIGQPVCPAESFTCAFDGYRQHPASVKNEGDWAFAGGVNRFMYHTFEHQPLADSLRPGMTMGIYGVHWDRGQTWWYLSDAYHRYVSRCQFMLQQGRTVADVMYLIPEGAPHVFLPPVSATECYEPDIKKYRNSRNTSMMPDRRGYNFDGCTPGIFMKAEVRDSIVVLPGGAEYRLVVLPAIETMTPALLGKIKKMISEGAKITGSLPVKSPSLSGYPYCDEEVITLADEIIKMSNFIEYKGETDNLYPPYEVTAGILGKTTPPDFVSGGEVRFTHRTTATEEIYFISNRTDTIQQTVAAFRITGFKPELWNPVTGDRCYLPEYSEKNGCTEIPVRFYPYESFFIIFRKPSGKKSATHNTAEKNFPEPEEIYTVESPWEVRFDPKWGGPEKVIFNTLEDWSKNDNDSIKYYSGTAIYSTTINELNEIKNYKTIYLDLGNVKNIAKVSINGKEFGTVWTSPWIVDITGALKSGENSITVEVVNLWANRLIGDEKYPADANYRDHEAHENKWPDWLLNGEPRTSGRYTFTTNREYRADSPLLESGLTGPVRIIGIK